MPENEQERIRRLRDAQIHSRDPGVSKIRHYDWAKHAAKPKKKQPPLLVEMFSLLPSRWKGALLGPLFGSMIGILVMLFVPDDLDALALLPVMICGVVGMILGKLFQNDTLLR